MLIEIANSISNAIGVVENDLEVFAKMLVIPVFFLLRGVAFLGIMYPIFLCAKNVFDDKRDIGESVILAVCWILCNSMVLISPILSTTWKWIWIDVVGVLLGAYFLADYMKYQKTTNHYKNYNKNKKHHQIKNTTK